MGTEKNIKSNTDTPDLYFHTSRIPPQALDLEEAVLGSVMLESDTLFRVMEIVNPDMFYKENNRKIYATIIDMFKSGRAIDVLTLAEELKKKQLLESVGGAFYLSELINKVASTENIEHHCFIVYEQWLRREAIRIGTEAIRNSFDGEDVFETYEKAITQLINRYDINIGKSNDITSIVDKTIHAIDAIRKNPKDIIGIDTGYYFLNKLTLGFQAPDMIVVAARPSMGKTSAMMGLVNNISINKKIPSCVFSLEMSKEQLAYRLITQRTAIPYGKLQSGRFADQDMEKILFERNLITNSPLFVDDTPALDIISLRSRMTRLKKEKNIAIAFIDYLQLMVGRGKNINREQEISDISRGIKAICKDLNIPIVVLSQLNREVEKRTDRRPKLSDLRESGAVEQDADIVIFIHRPYVYKIDKPGTNPPEPYPKEYSEWIFAKHRNGPLETIEFYWQENSMSFFDTETKDIDDFSLPVSDLPY